MARGRGQGSGESSLRAITVDAVDSSAVSIRLPSHERNKIYYVRDEKTLVELVEDLKQYPVLALDIETAAVRGYGVENGAPRTIQLGAQTKNWYKRAGVVDLMHVEPHILFPLLEDPEIEIVIHNADYEQVWFDYRFDLKITNVFDTKVAARLVRRARAKELGVKPTSLHDLNLAAVAKAYAREEVDKTEQDSWWGRPKLELGQIEYAAKDVDIPLLVARRLKALAIEYGILDEIRAECEKVYPRCHKQVEAMRDRRDDYYVSKLLLENAENLEELEKAWVATRGLPLYHKSLRKLTLIYRSRKSTLSSGR